jgi:hypothetical protein
MKFVAKRVILETNAYKSSLSKVVHKGLAKDDLNFSVQKKLHENPLIGVIIPGTHGVRKFRHAMPGQGKRGSYRVVYYFYTESCPLYLLNIYAKNNADDISPESKIAFAKFVKELKRAK